MKLACRVGGIGPGGGSRPSMALGELLAATRASKLNGGSTGCCGRILTVTRPGVVALGFTAPAWGLVATDERPQLASSAEMRIRGRTALPSRIQLAMLAPCLLQAMLRMELRVCKAP